MNVRFDKKLLDHIRCGRNNEAKEMLTEELARAFDDSDVHGTLLHHAAVHDNVWIAQRLIELGANVNRLRGCRTTPLTTALVAKNQNVALVLFQADARIDIVDSYGNSAIKVILDSYYSQHSILVKLFMYTLKMVASTNEELAEKLISVGCNMSHAATFRDIDLMECMLKRGIDVNSKNLKDKTALHVAAELDDVNLADWLLNKGVDIDALDEDGSSALLKFAEKGNNIVVQLLLECGANPDGNDDIRKFNSLHAVFTWLTAGVDKFIKCAEILLQNGANLQGFDNFLEVLKCALDLPCDRAAKLLIAHLTMLEVLDKPVHHMMYLLNINNEIDNEGRWFASLFNGRQLTRISKLMQEYHEPCRQVLAVNVFEKWSLLDFLNNSDSKMRLVVRKETFLSEIEKVSSKYKLNESYSYYYNTMMRLIEKANRVVKLEDEAILVICKIFEANYNQFYSFARGAVEYLNERDLKNLVQV